jgi:carbonic anhydrase/acetyltransferase-like protein (isoleucine patch superfamily)
VPLYEHRGHQPVVDPSAYVAPTAVLCGDVHIGADARILFGAVITSEDGHVRVGERCVVMENALLRGRDGYPTELGDDVLVGPHVHVNGASVADGCFLATGCSLFPGSRLGEQVEVRVNGVVHANTSLASGATVPIGWVAVGDPAEILPPVRHDDIWAIQEGLEFTKTVYGVGPDTSARSLMERQAQWYGEHRNDRPVSE